MDTKYLSYILTIAKKENMTKAAEELFVSQSTLSQYLSKLESELGTPLFYRSKGRLTPTAAGRLYIDAAEKVMAIKDNLYQNIQNLDNRGHITIGVTSQFALRMLTELIPPFKSRFPDVTIEISEMFPPLPSLFWRKTLTAASWLSIPWSPFRGTRPMCSDGRKYSLPSPEPIPTAGLIRGGPLPYLSLPGISARIIY